MRCNAGPDTGSRARDGSSANLIDGEHPTMRMYFFDVTVKIMHHDVADKVIIYKGARASDELSARRAILNQLLDRRFQVVRIDRVPERCLRRDAG
jgi:hypothetical protein